MDDEVLEELDLLAQRVLPAPPKVALIRPEDATVDVVCQKCIQGCGKWVYVALPATSAEVLAPAVFGEFAWLLCKWCSQEWDCRLMQRRDTPAVHWTFTAFDTEVAADRAWLALMVMSSR